MAQWIKDRCEPPRFDAEAEATHLFASLTLQFKAMGYDIQPFRMEAVRRNGSMNMSYSAPVKPGSDALCRFLFYTKSAVGLSTTVSSSVFEWFKTVAGQDTVNLDIINLYDGVASPDDLLDELVHNNACWPMGWEVEAYRVTEADKILLKLQTRPYKLLSLTQVIGREPELFHPNIDNPIVINESCLTERTPANANLRTAIQKKMNFLSDTATSINSVAAQARDLLKASMKAVQLAISNWEIFKTAALSSELKLTSIQSLETLQMSFSNIVRGRHHKPNGQIWFSTANCAFTLFYDLFYGFTSVHLPPDFFLQNGIGRMHHTVSLMLDQLQAEKNKPKTKKQKVLVEKPDDSETNEEPVTDA